MANISAAAEIVQSSRNAKRAVFAEFWHYFSANRGALIGIAILAVIVVGALLASVIAPHAPNAQYREYILLPPAWQDGGRTDFLLGTDAVGRDILSRLIYGARFSLFIGLAVVTIALTSGIVIGLICGYFGGWIDTLISRIMDVILAFPALLLALVV